MVNGNENINDTKELFDFEKRCPKIIFCKSEHASLTRYLKIVYRKTETRYSIVSVLIIRENSTFG